MKTESEKRRFQILYLTGGFEWHGQYELEKKEIELIKKWDAHITKNDDSYDVTIKKHHKTFKTNNEYALKRIAILDNEPINGYDYLAKYDLIVSSYIPSTLLFECLWLGKRTVFIESKNIYALTNQKMFRTTISVIGENEFIDSIKKIVLSKDTTKNNLEYYISSDSLYADKIIADYINTYN